MNDSRDPWMVTSTVLPATALSQPTLLKREDMTAQDPLPKQQIPGYTRSRFTTMFASNAFCSLVSIDAGQRTPTHSSDADHIIVGVDGRVTFFTNGEMLAVESQDLLLIPAGIPYRYSNDSDGLAVFFSVVSRSDVWPPTSTYWND